MKEAVSPRRFPKNQTRGKCR